MKIDKLLEIVRREQVNHNHQLDRFERAYDAKMSVRMVSNNRLLIEAINPDSATSQYIIDGKNVNRWFEKLTLMCAITPHVRVRYGLLEWLGEPEIISRGRVWLWENVEVEDEYQGIEEGEEDVE